MHSWGSLNILSMYVSMRPNHYFLIWYFVFSQKIHPKTYVCLLCNFPSLANASLVDSLYSLANHVTAISNKQESIMSPVLPLCGSLLEGALMNMPWLPIPSYRGLGNDNKPFKLVLKKWIQPICFNMQTYFYIKICL